LSSLPGLFFFDVSCPFWGLERLGWEPERELSEFMLQSLEPVMGPTDWGPKEHRFGEKKNNVKSQGLTPFQVGAGWELAVGNLREGIHSFLDSQGDSS
jgi:hypothetical protein